MLLVAHCRAGDRQKLRTLCQKQGVFLRFAESLEDVSLFPADAVLLSDPRSSYGTYTEENPFLRFLVVGDDKGYGLNVSVHQDIERAVHSLFRRSSELEDTQEPQAPKPRKGKVIQYKKRTCPRCDRGIGTTLNLRRHLQACEMRSLRPVVTGRRTPGGPLALKLPIQVVVQGQVLRPGLYIIVGPRFIELLLPALEKLAQVRIEDGSCDSSTS